METAAPHRIDRLPRHQRPTRLELQVRVVEEPYLLTVHAEAYRDYLAHVGRFVPGVGLSL